MKKGIIYCLLAITLFLSIPNVEASHLCTGSKTNALKVKAYQTQITQVQKFDENHISYWEITIYNVDKDLLVKHNGAIYEPDKNGAIVIESKFNGGVNYEFNFYGGYDTDCVEEFVYQKTIRLPVYNYYSEREECIEYEEFPLCNKWYKGVIGGEEDFLQQLEAYKESLKPKEEPKKEEDNRNIFEKLIDFYLENQKYTVPITCVIGVLVVAYVVRSIIRRRKRVKLDM